MKKFILTTIVCEECFFIVGYYSANSLMAIIQKHAKKCSKALAIESIKVDSPKTDSTIKKILKNLK